MSQKSKHRTELIQCPFCRLVYNKREHQQHVIQCTKDSPASLGSLNHAHTRDDILYGKTAVMNGKY